MEQPVFRARIITGPEQLERIFDLRTRCFGRSFVVDSYETNAEHLIVEELTSGRLVGAYRLTISTEAPRLETELYFDIAPLLAQRKRVLELGWACVDAHYRNGGVVGHLWRALAYFIVSRKIDVVIGPTGVPEMSPARLGELLGYLRRNSFELGAARISSRNSMPYPIIDSPATELRSLPTMLRAYLALGAKILLEPVFDPKSNCYDLLTVLDVAENASKLRGLLRHGSAHVSRIDQSVENTSIQPVCPASFGRPANF